MEPAQAGNEELRKAAIQRVRARRDVGMHVLVYAVVNGALFLIWLATGRGYPWFLWPLIGWGIGLVLHVVTTFIEVGRPEREARAVERELRRMRGHRGPA